MTGALICVLIVLLSPAASMRAEGDLGHGPGRGKELYLKSCSQCHGEAGDGKGPAAERLLPKPRDFTSGVYKIRTTPNGEIPTDGDLARAISEGLPGSTMPGWGDVYGEGRIRDLVAYLKTFSERFKTEKPSKVYSLKGAKRATPESIANGRKIYLEMQCNACHGMEGRADGPSAPSLTDDSGNPIRPANLRKGWNFRGGHRVTDIFRTFMTGLNGTPMPSYVDALGENPEGLAKAWDLANYVRSLSPDRPETAELVRSRRHDGALPASPDDPAWEAAAPAGFLLFGQIVEDPRRFVPSVDYVKVRSLYNADAVAFLAEWDDATQDPTEEQKAGAASQARPDSFQFQLPLALYPDSQEGERPYFLEGDASHPAGLWRWDSKSDKVANLRSTGLSSRKVAMVSGEGRRPADGGRRLADEGLFVSSSSYADGRWRLVVQRKLRVAAWEGLSLEPGTYVPLAFSAWDGSNGDEGLKRSVSSWYYLTLEPARPKALYGAPVLAFVLAGGLEFWLLRRRRGRRVAKGAGGP